MVTELRAVVTIRVVVTDNNEKEHRRASWGQTLTPSDIDPNAIYILFQIWDNSIGYFCSPLH